MYPLGKTISLGVAGALLSLGCGASIPPQTQQVVEVESANRSAAELGARTDPRAQLHLKLAEEQLQQAKMALEDDDSEAADMLLARAKADAELALALSHDAAATREAEKAKAQNAKTMPQIGAVK